MTFAPPSLLDARAYLKPMTGLTSVELGIAGDPAHAAKGTSYHLGADQLTDDAYSRRTTRDRAGLTDAASALDIGMFARLRELSVWLVAQCRANAPDTRDIREVIYSPDGKVVWRWDRERGVTSLPRTGEASDSHLTHTHVSWYRDSEFRDRTAVFRRFFEGDDMTADQAKMLNDIWYALFKGSGTNRPAASLTGELDAAAAADKADAERDAAALSRLDTLAADVAALKAQRLPTAVEIAAELIKQLGGTGPTAG